MALCLHVTDRLRHIGVMNLSGSRHNGCTQRWLTAALMRTPEPGTAPQAMTMRTG